MSAKELRKDSLSAAHFSMWVDLCNGPRKGLQEPSFAADGEHCHSIGRSFVGRGGGSVEHGGACKVQILGSLRPCCRGALRTVGIGCGRGRPPAFAGLDSELGSPGDVVLVRCQA